MNDLSVQKDDELKVCNVEGLEHDFHEILKDFPQVLLYINRLLSIISRQHKSLAVLSKNVSKTQVGGKTPYNQWAC